MSVTIDHNLVKALQSADTDEKKAEVLAKAIAEAKSEFTSPMYQFKTGGWLVLLLIGGIAWGGVELYKLNATVAKVEVTSQQTQQIVKGIDNKLEKLISK